MAPQDKVVVVVVVATAQAPAAVGRAAAAEAPQGTVVGEGELALRSFLTKARSLCRLPPYPRKPPVLEERGAVAERACRAGLVLVKADQRGVREVREERGAAVAQAVVARVVFRWACFSRGQRLCSMQRPRRQYRSEHLGPRVLE